MRIEADKSAMGAINRPLQLFHTPRLAANIDSIMGVMVYSKINKGVFLYIRMLQIACGQWEQERLLVGKSGPVL